MSTSIYWTNFSKEQSSFGEYKVLTYDPSLSEKCPKCTSPSPELHPAVQFEGEVQVCEDPWHDQKDYWEYRSNIDVEYMDTRMTTKDIKSFLFQMMDIYKRKARQ